MKEEKVTVDELAAKLDQFGYDFDPYGYMDNVSSREEGIAQIKGDLLRGNLSGYREYLQEVVEEEGEFAQEAADLLDMMDRYERPEWLSVQEKQSILNRIAEITGSGKVPQKEKGIPAKEEVR